MPDPCLQIALPVPLRRLFDYLPGGEGPLPRPGQRVQVPFGHQTLTGIVVGSQVSSKLSGDKLRAIHRVLDSDPLLPGSLLQLVQWAADYYQHPFGDALLSVLPAPLRDGEAARLPLETWWRLTVHGKGLPEGALRRSHQQAAALALLQQADCPASVLRAAGVSAAVLGSLHHKKLIESFEKESTAAVPLAGSEDPPLALNQEQEKAVAAIANGEGFRTCLLQGVTGSGKTEVYLQAIAQVLQQGRQVLVLVPEIGLTPQTVERFRKRFRYPIVTLHSGLNDRERCTHWLQATRGEAAIVIGTRSAVFAPLPRLGMIVVDEEHDASFKQQDGFRYHARDVAIVRAQRENIPIVLGSATPSLESLRNAESGRYRLLCLTSRAGQAQTPRLHLLDISREKLQHGFSSLLIDTIRQTLQQGEQVMVFINRRGYAPVLICADCGAIATCRHCDARLTVHKQERQLRCHHCGWQSALWRECSSCHGHHLDVIGVGTQRSEEALGKLFPDVRILRIDRDSTARKHAMRDALGEIQGGQPMILVGTQMLAKGHHFPAVTLVAILEADSGMFSADFRSAEKLAQLLTQVSGRAGRADKPGQVILQSAYCEHPLMQQLVQQDYPTLARELLRERQRLALPPWRTQALIRAESPRREQAEQLLRQVRSAAEALLGNDTAVQLLGPLPALMEKKAGRYRQELIFTSAQRPNLQKLLRELALQLENQADARKVRWAIDVDPV